MTRPIFFPATHKSERRGERTRTRDEFLWSRFNCISLVAKSEKDTVRLNSAETRRRPRGPKPTGIGPTARRAGRNHSSADLLLLISIKFNPARLAVGGAFTSCNSCLPLWSFSRGMPTLYQNARLWTLHYISRHETNKETHINKWTRDIERYRATAVLRDGNVAPSDRTLLLHLLSLLVSRYKACREFLYE